MAFTIPDRAITYPFQSRWFESDIAIIQAAAAGRNGVILGGCEVTESTIPAGTTEVEVGQVVIDNTLVDVAAQTVGHDVADALLPRFDLVVVYDDGTATSLAGTPDAAPLVPLPDTDSVGLAQVFIPAGDTAIEDEQIVDKRIYVESPLAPSDWQFAGASADLPRASNATLSIDPILQFAMTPSAAYRIRFHALFTGAVASSGGWKFGIFGPTSPTVWSGSYALFGNQFSGAATSFNEANLNLTQGSYGNAFTVPPRITLAGDIIFINGSNAGTFGLAWAQSAADTDAITRQKGSYLEYQVA